jgi:hypothetical protein
LRAASASSNQRDYRNRQTAKRTSHRGHCSRAVFY